jgi:uncharacterized membrane protein
MEGGGKLRSGGFKLGPIVLVFVLISSMLFITAPVQAPGVIERTIEVTVVQGDVFLLRHKMYFDEPGEKGRFAFTIYWENLSEAWANGEENFTLENWSVYWEENGEPLDNIEVVAEAIQSEVVEGWKIKVECTGEWGDGNFYVDLWLRAASGDGTPHRPVSNHPILYSAGVIAMREPSPILVYASPITVRVLSTVPMIYITPSYQSRPPGATLEYMVFVTNITDELDNYDLFVWDNAGWSLELSENELLNVENGASENVRLIVTIPENAESCVKDNIVVKVTSRTDPGLSAEDWCIAHSVIRGVEISISPNYQSATPGSSPTYNVLITNTGEVSEEYVLTAVDNENWGPTLLPPLLTLDPGVSENVILSIQVPENAEPSTNNILVTVVSAADPSVRAESSCILDVIIPKPRIIVRGDDGAYNLHFHADPPWQWYEAGDYPPLAAAKEVGNGRVVAATFVSTCRDGRWEEGEFDVLLDEIFQWLKPGAKKVLWYQGHGVYNNTERCGELVAALEALGYDVDGKSVQPITPDLLEPPYEPYDILIIPQLQDGGKYSGGDPDQLLDSEVQAIKDFVEEGGGLLIMEGTDFHGYNFYKNQNKILEALDFGIYFQCDSVYDEGAFWFDAEVLKTDFGAEYRARTGKTTVRVYSVSSLAPYGMSVSATPVYQEALPGGELTYTIEIVNWRYEGDNFSLTIDDDADWSLMLDEDLFEIPPFESATTTLKITIPSDVPLNTLNTITVTSTSLTDPTLTNSFNFEARAVMRIRPPVEDAYVHRGRAENAIGGSGPIYVGRYRYREGSYEPERGYFKFDLMGLPDGMIIEKARLYLFCYSVREGGIKGRLYGAGDDWLENEITWNNQPTWGAPLDITHTMDIEDRWYSWDVTPFVVSEFLSDKVASFCLMDLDEETGNVNRGVSISSSEYTDVYLHPYLAFGYDVSIWITPRYEKGLPMGTLSYIVIVRNMGAFDDTYDLTVSDTENWGLRLSENSLSIPAGGSEIARLYVTIPSNAQLGTLDNIRVTATSRGNPEVSSTHWCTAEAAMRLKPPMDDSHVVEGDPDDTHGDAWQLYVGSSTGGDYKNERAFLKFNLDAIPENIGIGRVNLYLYCFGADGRKGENVQLWGVANDDWREETITWNNQPALENLLDVVAITAEDSWYAWDVTSFVKDQLKGDKIASFCLKAARESLPSRDQFYYGFDSKEFDNKAFHPYLEVVLPEYGVALFISPSSRKGLEGDVLTYTVTVTNTGNVPDNYRLTVSDTLGWEPVLENEFLEILPSRSETTGLSVRIPDNALPGEIDNILLVATSIVNPAIRVENSCTAEVVIMGVEVYISPDRRSGAPGRVLIYEVEVRNVSRVEVSYTLSVSDTRGWNPTLSQTSLTLAARATGEVTLSVTIPEGALLGTEDEITVVATSTENAEITDNYTCIALAIMKGVRVTVSPSYLENQPGGTLIFTVLVRNIGLDEDTYSLTVEGDNRWTPHIEPASLTVAALSSQVATLSVTIPSDAADGDSITITVTVTSALDPTITSSATCRAAAREAVSPFGMAAPVVFSVIGVAAIVLWASRFMLLKPKS